MIIFSIIVPTYERSNDLEKCLECIRNGNQVGMYCTGTQANYEIIVTDDGKNDESRLLIFNHFKDVKWTRGLGKGPAANRNNGAKVAQGKWLVFTDDDCLPSKNLLRNYFKFITTNSGVLALEGAIHPTGSEMKDMVECPVNYDGGNFWSANIAVKKEFFDNMGGFDENYPYPKNEDQDLKIRIEKEAEIQFVKDAVVFHPVRHIGLISSILTLPKICDSWSYHVTKHGNTLGFDSKFAVISASFTYALRTMFQNFKRQKYRLVLLNWISFISSPFLLYFYLKKYQGATDVRS